MKWLEEAGVHVLAAVATLALTLATILGSLGEETPHFTIEPDKRTIVYDASLAYLGAYIFYLLVNVLPRRRRQDAMRGALHGHLMVIANTGHDLIRDLEFIGRCPERRITEEHTRKVLTSVSDSPAVWSVIGTRLAHVSEEYDQVAPYMEHFSLELQIALQAARRAALHSYVPKDLPDLTSLTIDDHREEVVIDLCAPVDGSPQLSCTPTRRHLGGYVAFFKELYEATETVKLELEKHGTRLLYPFPAPGRYILFINDKINVSRPIVEYPATATSSLPASALEDGLYRLGKPRR